VLYISIAVVNLERSIIAHRLVGTELYIEGSLLPEFSPVVEPPSGIIESADSRQNYRDKSFAKNFVGIH